MPTPTPTPTATASRALEPRTCLLRSPRFLSGDLDGQVLVLDLDTGRTLHLNGPAAAILALLEPATPRSVEWLCDRLVEEYAVDPHTCREDVLAALAHFVVRDVVQVAG